MNKQRAVCLTFWLIFLCPVAPCLAEADREPSPFDQQFMMTQFRADEELEAFEIWHLIGDFSTQPLHCQLRATTVFRLWGINGWTNEWELLSWIHEATRITKLPSGEYRLDMTAGRPSFKGLEVILRFGPDGKIADISGTDPGDPSFRFWLDRKRKGRTVTIRNPSPDLLNLSPGFEPLRAWIEKRTKKK